MGLVSDWGSVGAKILRHYRQHATARNTGSAGFAAVGRGWCTMQRHIRQRRNSRRRRAAAVVCDRACEAAVTRASAPCTPRTPVKTPRNTPALHAPRVLIARDRRGCT